MSIKFNLSKKFFFSYLQLFEQIIQWRIVFPSYKQKRHSLGDNLESTIYIQVTSYFLQEPLELYFLCHKKMSTMHRVTQMIPIFLPYMEEHRIV